MFWSKGTIFRYQSYYEELQGYERFVCKWDLICTVNRFMSKGNWCVCVCVSVCVAVVCSVDIVEDG